ncbi:MAG: ABC transporter ATP-binding protein [Solobacterium sp.]|jgi:iron complex transport system ATP-binding protein|nr:ABC transporter ATP-binding protein [Solobacterium sp.]MCH4205044.1 ABC transporter ATP-binding protein [Solobacterium sp.]MCH4226553.1 ABC transporter ATP-binding protein [Solobacterium sp.]MCH4281837.1 ABC transporter ATP-binding protein [Solobacterium sp.]
MNFSVKEGCFSYSENKEVLDHVSFQIHSGEILSILGPNGGGKTTLLKCMLGFLKFTSGYAEYDGHDLSAIKQTEFWQKAAYVPQAKSQTFPYLVKETVLLGRSPYLNLFQMPNAEDKRIAQKAMERTGITALAEKSCAEISGGELQLVLIARALAAQPELLVMDEPETGLDFRNQLLVLEMIEKLSKEDGISVIFNTHYPEHALEVSDHTLLLMKNGKSIFGETKKILNEQNMSEAFGVKIKIIEEEINGRKHSTILPVSLEEESSR